MANHQLFIVKSVEIDHHLDLPCVTIDWNDQWWLMIHVDDGCDDHREWWWPTRRLLQRSNVRTNICFFEAGQPWPRDLICVNICPQQQVQIHVGQCGCDRINHAVRKKKWMMKAAPSWEVIQRFITKHKQQIHQGKSPSWTGHKAARNAYSSYLRGRDRP